MMGGEACALVDQGRGRAFSRKWTVAPFHPFLVLIVWSWSLVGVSFNMLM